MSRKLWRGLVDGRRGTSCHNIGESAVLRSWAEAKLWIMRNQLSRRNLTTYQRVELVMKVEEEIAELARANMRATQQNDAASAYQKSDKQVHTLDELGKLAGVSRDTVHKARVIDREADERTKAQLRAGERTSDRAGERFRQH